MDFFETARINMVKNQVKAQGIISNPLLISMLNTPREIFIPQKYIEAAYTDFDIPIDESRFALRPAEIARFIDAAKLKPQDFVIDVGCKLGYITSIVSKMTTAVVGIENSKPLAEIAKKALINVDNAAIINSDINNGLPNQAPFDVILLEELFKYSDPPEIFLNQLADNGRLLFITGNDPILTVHVITKKNSIPSETFSYQFLLNPIAKTI